jgi:hypothetical protein
MVNSLAMALEIANFSQQDQDAINALILSIQQGESVSILQRMINLTCALCRIINRYKHHYERIERRSAK